MKKAEISLKKKKEKNFWHIKKYITYIKACIGLNWGSEFFNKLSQN